VSAGADVVVADHPSRQAEAARLVHELTQGGRRAVAVPLDVTNLPGIDEAFSLAEEALGPVGIVVANAGVNIRRPALEVSEADWDTVLDINLKGVFFTCQSAGKRMVPRQRGAIVAIASQHGVVATPRSPAYCAAKAGLWAYGESLRALLGPQGVGVTTIAPGFFTSAMSDRFTGNHPLKLGTEAAARRITQAIARDAGRCIFPRRMGLALRLLDLLPAALADGATRRFRFKIQPD
jgi:2-deoxy-D-gluconate 3-dehydrogenase